MAIVSIENQQTQASEGTQQPGSVQAERAASGEFDNQNVARPVTVSPDVRAALANANANLGGIEVEDGNAGNNATREINRSSGDTAEDLEIQTSPASAQAERAERSARQPANAAPAADDIEEIRGSERLEAAAEDVTPIETEGEAEAAVRPARDVQTRPVVQSRPSVDMTADDAENATPVETRPARDADQQEVVYNGGTLPEVEVVAPSPAVKRTLRMARSNIDFAKNLRRVANSLGGSYMPGIQVDVTGVGTNPLSRIAHRMTERAQTVVDRSENLTESDAFLFAQEMVNWSKLSTMASEGYYNLRNEAAQSVADSAKKSNEDVEEELRDQHVAASQRSEVADRLNDQVAIEIARQHAHGPEKHV